jgi:hypothetical protein
MADVNVNERKGPVTLSQTNSFSYAELGRAC